MLMMILNKKNKEWKTKKQMEKATINEKKTKNTASVFTEIFFLLIWVL